MKYLSISTIQDAAAVMIQTIGTIPEESVIIALTSTAEGGAQGLQQVMRLDVSDDPETIAHQVRSVQETVAQMQFSVDRAILGIITDRAELIPGLTAVFSTVQTAEDAVASWQITGDVFTDHATGATCSTETLMGSAAALELAFADAGTRSGMRVPRLPEFTAAPERAGTDVQAAWANLVTGFGSTQDAHTVAAAAGTGRPGFVEMLACVLMDPTQPEAPETMAATCGVLDISQRFADLFDAEQIITTQVAPLVPESCRGPLWEFLAWTSWVQARSIRAHQCLDNAAETENPRRGPLIQAVTAQTLPTWVYRREHN